MKKQQTRIFQKHDTEANWKKNGTNFVPGPGEIIIYDKDEEHSAPRIKIGDGGTKVADLGFLGSGEFNGEASLKISDLENDVGYITKTELVYDTIIHSQEEWDAMTSTENWNGASNILLKCSINIQMGTRDKQGSLKIPLNVCTIDGNHCSIWVFYTDIQPIETYSPRLCLFNIGNFQLVKSKWTHIRTIHHCNLNIIQSSSIQYSTNIVNCSASFGDDGTLVGCDTILLDSDSMERIKNSEYEVLVDCTNVIYEKTKQSEFQNDVNGNIRNGEGTGSIEIGDETNTAMSPNSVAGGKNSVSGIKGYYIKAINFSERKILLDVDVTELRTPPGTPEITTNAILPTVTEDLPYSTGKYIGIINKNHYVFLTTIEAINGNVITYAGNPYSVGFSSFVSNLTESDEYMFFVPEEPEKGIVCFTECGVAFGDAAKAASFALSVGENSVAYIYGLATGKNTIAGFGSVAEGIDTKALALASHTEGYGTKALSHVQHVQGKYNVVDVNNEFAHIVGNGTSDSDRSNAHTVDWDGNAWYAGTIYNGFTDIYVPFATNPAYYINHGEAGLVFVYKNNEDFPGFTKDDKIAISLGSVQYICSINGVWDESDPGNFGRDGQYGIRININDDNEILIPDSSEKYTTYDIVGTKLEGASFYTIEKKKVFNAKDTIVTGIGAPIADEDAVPKRYVDSKKLSEFENDIGLGAGATGKDGKSAYEYAKEGGYTGSEEEFAAKLANEYTINPLHGKKVSFLGDSICAGSSDNGTLGGYGKIIADRNNMSYQNLGKGGATITAETYSSSTGYAKSWLCRMIENMDADADYAIIEGGINDAWQWSDHGNIEIGGITEGYNAELDETTYYGAFESMLKQLVTKFKGKKIGYIAVPKIMSLYDSERNAPNFYHIALECCAKWGVPVCDLNNIIPPTEYLKTLGSEYTTDGTHPTYEGYLKFYCDPIEVWMRTLTTGGSNSAKMVRKAVEEYTKGFNDAIEALRKGKLDNAGISFRKAKLPLADGTTIEIDVLTAVDGTVIVPFVNRVPLSVDTDGNVFGTDYNGDGINDGYLKDTRLSSSGAVKEQAGCTATGFIPVKGGDVIRVYGCDWATALTANNYICAYDKDFVFIGGYATTIGDTLSLTKYGTAICSEYSADDNRNLTITLSSLSDIAYIRVSSKGHSSNNYPSFNSEDMIITVNEEIS